MYLYEITNIKDQKRYVGITNNVKRRWKEHRSELKRDKHRNQHLQSAWNLYGKECFDFKILNDFNNLDDLCKAEIKYIKDNDLLNSNFGYNLDPGGSGSFRHTEDAKKRISKSNEKAVVAMCLKTSKIKHYNRILDVEKDGFNPKSIGNACVDRALTYMRYVWMYKKDYNKNPNKLTEKMENRQNVKARPSRYKKVFGMNIITKEIIKYDAVYHSKKDGFAHTTIYNCCVDPDVNKSHKGYVWSFNKKNLILKRNVVLKGNISRKDIYKFDLNGKLLGKIDRNCFDRNTTKGIQQVCSGQRETYKGYKYSYKEILENTKYTKTSFIKLSKNNNIIARYINIQELLADSPNVTNTSSIYKCCDGQLITAYGYKWKREVYHFCS